MQKNINITHTDNINERWKTLTLIGEEYVSPSRKFLPRARCASDPTLSNTALIYVPT